ncbi:hypothetical protein [Thermodesulfobium sp.]|jgi:hypothetical protein
MKKFIFQRVTVALLICSLFFLSPAKLYAFNLGSILEGGGIAIAVKIFGRQINDFINTALMNRNISTQEMTKVVPIISIGNGTYVGAAQVSGPAERVQTVQAVMQLELNFSDNKFRIKALIPSDSLNPLKFSRVLGVGVSAMIDVKL